MKKIIKKKAIFLLALILMLVIFVVVWVFLISPNFVDQKDELVEYDPDPVQIAENSEKIDFNEDNGVLYVNDEVIVFVKTSSSENEIAALFDTLGGQVDESMADINVYRLFFEDAMTYEELEALVKKIKSNHIVDDVYLNTASQLDH